MVLFGPKIKCLLVLVIGEISIKEKWFKQWLWKLVKAEICYLQGEDSIFNAEIFAKQILD